MIRSVREVWRVAEFALSVVVGVDWETLRSLERGFEALESAIITKWYQKISWVLVVDW